MLRWLGLVRSLIMYYSNPLKLWRMQGFYAQFIKPGDLAFDIGSHVGNRLWIWSRLGAHVVALEPQPLFFEFLQRWYGKRPGVALIEAAAGAAPGEATLWISERTPTVTTVSRNWINDVRQAKSFATVEWQTQITVPLTTLDQLIATHGLPTFCKIDVEGFEADVLQGLSQPISVLSIEYVPATIAIALACIERLAQLGTYEFNWSIGESHRWQRHAWLSANEMCDYLTQLTIDDKSGDIYARLIDKESTF